MKSGDLEVTHRSYDAEKGTHGRVPFIIFSYILPAGAVEGSSKGVVGSLSSGATSK